MLEILGLSQAAEAVYLAMLDDPEAVVADIARGLDLTEREVRQALDELARLSLLSNSLSDPALLQPVNPEIGLATLMARIQADVARRQQQVEETRASVAMLLARHALGNGRKPEQGIECIDGIEPIRRRLAELAASCEWEACSFMPGGAQSQESLAASRTLDADAIDRGVRLRTIYLDSVRNDQPTLQYANWLSELGSEVRTVPSLPLRMLIVDRRLAMVPVNTDDTAARAVLVSGGGLLTALVALFNSVWKTALPLARVHRRESNGLAAQELQVLKLLCAGLTDEMIARRLGVSPRTARRAAADLLGRMGARSRFQAGARAALNGWIDVDDLD